MSQSRVRQVSAPIAINLVTPAKELNHDAQFPNLRFEVEAPKAKKTRGNERASKLDYDEQASKQTSIQSVHQNKLGSWVCPRIFLGAWVCLTSTDLSTLYQPYEENRPTSFFQIL